MQKYSGYLSPTQEGSRCQHWGIQYSPKEAR